MKVAITGVGQTRQIEDQNEETFETLVFEAVNAALADAQMEISEIEGVVTVSNDFFDGRTISGMSVTAASGSVGKNVSTVEGDGTYGAFYGLSRVLSTAYRNTLVVAHAKSSEFNSAMVGNAMFDPLFVRSLGIDATLAAAMQARLYLDTVGAGREELQKIVDKNFKNSNANPYVDSKIYSKAEELLAPPLRRADIARATDGAAAIILSHTDYIKKGQKPVYVHGVGLGTDQFDLGLRELTQSPALEAAAAMAYQMAGISDPQKEIDIAELYDPFSYMEPMWYEGLGFCKQGEGIALLRQGVTGAEGQIAVNLSGGLLPACTPLTAGLVRIIEAALQIRGEAACQREGEVKRALAHGSNGVCAQSHCVWVLGRERLEK